MGEELDSAGVHDFLDPYLTYLSLGGAQRSFYHVNASFPQFFHGCLSNFTINREIQPFDGSGSVFSEIVQKGNVVAGCNGALGNETRLICLSFTLHKLGFSGAGNAAIQDPLSIGITLVIVFFVVLLVAILVSFVVFRLRKQYKEKTGSPNGSNNIHSKQNGGHSLGTVGKFDSFFIKIWHNVDMENSV